MKVIHLVHLYPKEMNIYGDTGNRIVLQQRLLSRDLEVRLSQVGIGDFVPKDSDIIIGGGGQDAGQSVVQHDLADKANDLHKLAADGVVMLMVCGMYQLFGRRFITGEGEELKGINLLPLETTAGKTRYIGNTVYDTPWGEVVGYENHSGLTHLDNKDQAFARVKKGAGNNGQDGTEGCLINNVFGTYSHGPVLSKNPQFADELICRALNRKYGTSDLLRLDDKLEHKAAELAKKRPR
jgi:lipid II isoglutaminyl synthase (glutamine-hydrolysing)